MKYMKILCVISYVKIMTIKYYGLNNSMLRNYNKINTNHYVFLFF